MNTARPKALDAWKGEFGDRCTERNPASADAVRGRVRIWSEALSRTTVMDDSTWWLFRKVR